LQVELLQIYFFEWSQCLLIYVTASATTRQKTISRMLELLNMENEKGIVFYFVIKVDKNYTNDSSILLKPSAADRFSHNI
jgi:hypothetical protein